VYCASAVCRGAFEFATSTLQSQIRVENPAGCRPPLIPPPCRLSDCAAVPVPPAVPSAQLQRTLAESGFAAVTDVSALISPLVTALMAARLRRADAQGTAVRQ